MRAKVIHEGTGTASRSERTFAIEGHVRPTLEVILVESPHFLQRTHDEESGLALIDISPSEETATSGRRTAGA